ncbi:MAG: hypothetical protein D6761_12910, partial [Candidatus Dadabacteria bacterium]
GLKADLRAIASDTFAMQYAVDFGQAPRRLLRIRRDPGIPKCLATFTPAPVAGSVTGRERGRLVEEEQLRVSTRAEYLTAFPLVLKRTQHPVGVAPTVHDALMLVVQDPAITHPGAACVHSQQVTEGVDSIL